MFVEYNYINTDEEYLKILLQSFSYCVNTKTITASTGKHIIYQHSGFWGMQDVHNYI